MFNKYYMWLGFGAVFTCFGFCICDAMHNHNGGIGWAVATGLSGLIVWLVYIQNIIYNDLVLDHIEYMCHTQNMIKEAKEECLKCQQYQNDINLKLRNIATEAVTQLSTDETE